MRVIIGVLLAATLGGFIAPATAALSIRTPAAYAAYARLHAIAREVDRAAIARHAPDASIDARIATLHREVNALAAARSAPVASSDLLPLRVLLHNIERQRATAASRALLPAHRDAAQRSRYAVLDAAHGGTCGSAYTLAANGEIDGMLPADAVLWLRIDAERAGRIALTTAASPLATAIDVFDECSRDSAVAPRASAQGPGAHASVEAARTLTVRIRNLGAAGDIAVIAGADSAIEGTITDASTGAPLWTAGVFAFDAQGFITFGTTDSDGHYSIAVAAGSYAVLASMEHYVSEAWPDQPCRFVFSVPNCTGGPPQRIDVAGVITGIDIALGHGGTIAGRVREEGTNVVIDGGSVSVYDVDGYDVGDCFLDEAGRYAVDGLIAGTYRALAGSYTNGSELYDNIPCPGGSCDITNGTPIAVATDAFVGDIDFSLPRALYISATVHGPDSSTFGIVAVVDTTGNIVVENNVPPNAATPVGPLPAGTYYVVAQADYFIGQVFDHVDCTDAYCAFPYAGATPVVVSSATPTPSVAFDLHPLARVSGTITDATTHAALSGQIVTIWTTNDRPFVLASAMSDIDGTYQAFGIPAGSVWVTVASSDHRDTAYRDAACDDTRFGDIEGCDLAAATAVVVGTGASVTGIDVALPMNGSISGHVGTRGVDGHTLPLLSPANMRIYSPDGTLLSSGSTQGNGQWIVSDLIAGSYLARADVLSYYSQVWPEQDCVQTDDFCDPRVGTPIVVGDATAVHDIDFDPVASLGIVGRVVDTVTGQGVAGVGLDLWFAADGTHCIATASDIDGYYLLDGSYTPCWFGGAVNVSTDAGAPFIDQLFDGVSCPNGPAFLGLCPLAGATPIDLPAATPTPNVASFMLDRREGIFANGFD